MPGLLTPRFVSTWFASLFQGMSFFLFVHFPGFLRDDLGASEQQIGVIFAVTALSAIAVRPWMGRSIDRLGRRPLFMAGNVLNVVVVAAYLTVGAIDPWLFTVRIGHGIAIGLVFSAMLAYAADLVPPERRTQGLSLFGVAGLLPIAIGGFLGDLVIGRWGFDGLFITALALAVVGLLLTLPLDEVAPRPEPGTAVSFTRPLAQRDLLPMWWISFVFAMTLTAYFTFIRTFVDTTGVGSVGSFFGTYAATAILLRLLFGWVPDRVGPKRVLYPAFGIFGCGLVVLATAGDTTGIMIAGVLCGAGHGSLFPILFSVTFGRAAPRDRGSASAIFTGVFDMGTLVGGPLLGSLIVLVGYQSMYLITAGWLVVGTLVFAVWDGDLTRRRRRTPDPVGA